MISGLEFSAITEAAQRIRSYVHRTPVLTSQAIDSMCDARLFFKCDNLQKAGAFKARGACNAVFSLSEEEAGRGVLTHSSGNHAGELEFHIKSGGLKLGDRLYYGLKINGSCFTNMPKFGLPNIMGAIILFDGEKGFPLAIVDSIEPTIKRTGAGTAVAVKHLAKKDSKTLTICGCGNQGKIQLKAIKEVLHVQQVFAFDQDNESAKAYAEQMGRDLAITIQAVEDLAVAVGNSDVVITCTPSKKPFVMKEFVTPGTLVASIGSDSPDKQELGVSLMQGTKVVVDILEQCAMAGELHHALEADILSKDGVHAEIGQIVAGKKPGREAEDEIIIYDATGTALQDTAAAALCYEKAVEKQMGRYINFFE